MAATYSIPFKVIGYAHLSAVDTAISNNVGQHFGLVSFSGFFFQIFVADAIEFGHILAGQPQDTTKKRFLLSV